MAALTLRSIKGSPLTNNEVDANFTSLDQAKVELAGDIGGSTSSPLVVKLYGRAMSSSAPTTGQALIWTGTTWAPQNQSATGVTTVVNQVLKDISYQFDTYTQVFNLKSLSGAALTGAEYTDSNDMEVILDGRRLEPWIYDFNRWCPWQCEYDAGRTNSFRMRGGKIIFYKQPQRKTTGFIKINTKSASRQVIKYPLSPNNIAFGD